MLTPESCKIYLKKIKLPHLLNDQLVLFVIVCMMIIVYGLYH